MHRRLALHTTEGRESLWRYARKRILDSAMATHNGCCDYPLSTFICQIREYSNVLKRGLWQQQQSATTTNTTIVPVPTHPNKARRINSAMVLLLCVERANTRVQSYVYVYGHDEIIATTRYLSAHYANRSYPFPY